MADGAMNITDAFGALVLRHLDGVADEQERASLAKTLAADEAARAAFVWISSRHGEIREVLLPEASRTARRPRRARSGRRTVRWGAWAAVAACLLVVAGTVYYNLRQVEALPRMIAEVARVRQATSDVRVIRGQETVIAVVGLKLFEGDRVETATQGEMTSMKAAPSCSMAALMSGTSWSLSPENERATKVAPSWSAMATRSIALSVFVRPRLDFEPRSAVAENCPFVSPYTPLFSTM